MANPNAYKTPMSEQQSREGTPDQTSQNTPQQSGDASSNVHPIRPGSGGGPRGTAAMDPDTRQEVARKGGLAVSRNKEHMASIGRRGGQSVSRNREHMATIGRKGGAASRGSRGSTLGSSEQRQNPADQQQSQPQSAQPGLTTELDRNRGSGTGSGTGTSGV
jgi:general stress protein YciG